MTDRIITDRNGFKHITTEPQLHTPQRNLTDDRVIDCAKRLVEHADFQLGGSLSADSNAKDIPSNAVSKVKARHLAALRDALADHGIKE